MSSVAVQLDTGFKASVRACRYLLARYPLGLLEAEGIMAVVTYDAGGNIKCPGECISH